MYLIQLFLSSTISLLVLLHLHWHVESGWASVKTAAQPDVSNHTSGSFRNYLMALIPCYMLHPTRTLLCTSRMVVTNALLQSTESGCCHSKFSVQTTAFLRFAPTPFIAMTLVNQPGSQMMTPDEELCTRVVIAVHTLSVHQPTTR